MNSTIGAFSRAETGIDRQSESKVCKKLAHKVAVIAGASTGMGLATAKRFVQEGAGHVLVRTSIRMSRWRRV